MDLIKDVSQYIEAKVNEEVKKSQVLTQFLLVNYFTVGLGCLITGSHAKRFYGFDLPHEPRDKDLILLTDWLRDIYMLADSLMPKEYKTGSFGSITVTKDIENHFNKPIASFVWKDEFIEVFENLNKVHSTPSGYVPLNELIRCAVAWNRPKDQEFIKQLSTVLQSHWIAQAK